MTVTCEVQFWLILLQLALLCSFDISCLYSLPLWILPAFKQSTGEPDLVSSIKVHLIHDGVSQDLVLLVRHETSNRQE